MATAKGAGNVPATTKDKLPATTFDYGDDAGSGFENTKSSDLAIPFLGILQSNSPQVESDTPEGSKPGQLFNSVTMELIEADKDAKGGAAPGLLVQPVYKEHSFVEWVPREKGGGFVGLHDPESDLVKEALAKGGNKGKITLDNGNDLIETFYVYVQTLDEEGETPTGFAVISFTSTKIKPQRNWFTSMFMLKGKPPIFANRARLQTVKQKNDKGTFFNFHITPLGDTWAASLIPPGHELLDSAKQFKEMVTSGTARAAYETQNATGGNADGGDEAAPF